MPELLEMPVRPTLKQKARIPKREVGTYTMSHLVFWTMVGGIVGLVVGIVLGMAS